MANIADRILDLGIQLPPAPRPVAAYLPAIRSGNLLFVAGQVPFVDGELTARGPVPSVISIEAAAGAARQCALNGLAIVADHLGGDLERVEQIVRLAVFVASDPGFTDHPAVANGASEVLEQIFGDRGRHARAAVGAMSLPLGASVEVEMIVAVRD